MKLFNLGGYYEKENRFYSITANIQHSGETTTTTTSDTESVSEEMESTEVSNSPATGDHSKTAWCLFAMLIVGAGMVVIAGKKKNNI